MNSKINHRLLRSFVKTERLGPNLMRIAIALVFFWIGALKFVPYEADSITPLVAHNPVMSLFYHDPQDYKAHMTREGELVPEKRIWQAENNTYGFSTGLGALELVIGALIIAYPISKKVALVGAVLAFLTTLVTLSFLITTPEAWVPMLGDAQHGFPYLSGTGRLILKDTMMLAGAWIIAVDAALRVIEAWASEPLA